MAIVKKLVYILSKGHSNLTKDDIARMQKKSSRYLLSYLAGGSTRREVGSAFGSPFWGKERS